MDIEGYAAAKVLESLAMTDCLVAHISLRDKEPIWDGSVYVYSDRGNHKNECLKQRVPVQIKGQLEKNKKTFPASIKYPISTSDLEHYLTDGGVTFFIVRINREQNRSQIYARNLLPFIIKKLLSRGDSTKSISVEFYAFPKDERKIVNWFFNMITDMENQKAIARLGPLQSLEELQAQGPINKVFISFTDVAPDMTNPFKYLMNNRSFKYAELPSGITIPVDELPPVEKLSGQADIEISCGGHIFFNSYSIEYSREKEMIRLGKGISIVLDREANASTWYFSSNGTLKEIINDGSFLCKMFHEKEFFIGKKAVKLADNNYSTPEVKQKINNLEDHVQTLRNLDCALDKAGFHRNIIFNELSEQDIEKLNKLILSIISKQAVTLSECQDSSHVFVMKFAKYNILLAAIRVAKNKFQLVNFFHKGLSIKYSGESKQLKRRPAVIALTIDHFLLLDNIDYDVIYDEISTFLPVDDDYHAAVNQLLLRMLLAFDKNSNADLLSCAIKIAIWLCDQPLLINSAIDTLNLLQAVKRQRDLTEDEKIKLFEIIKNNPDDISLKTGAYIILQNFVEAQKAFEQLPALDQQNFAKWPIMKLWKDSDETCCTAEEI